MRSTPVILIAAHIFSMLGFSTYPALLPELQGAWKLSNSEAGIIGSFFFAGYIATVSSWTALTDRVDARWVYAAGSALASASSTTTPTRERVPNGTTTRSPAPTARSSPRA